MSQFTIYRSTDGSAPTLSGIAGDLTNLLDKCLADGYGSQSGAGWTKAYTATNRRAYKNGTGSTGLYWRVRDDAGGTGGAKEALIRGFETMSDVNTGTNPFPTSGQSSLTDNSEVIRKSAMADATTRPWIVAADAKTAYVFIQTGDQSNTYYTVALGDFYSLTSGDVWNAFVGARSTENASGAITNSELDVCAALNSSMSGFFMARNYNGAVGSTQLTRVNGLTSQTITGSLAGQSNAYLAYPNTPDNAIYLSRIFITPNANYYRGYFRGLWAWGHAGGVNDGDTFSGSGDLAGKTFLIIKASPNQGLFVIETSNTLP